MERFFALLSHAVEGAPSVAVLAAATWGVLSILLSPCHLSSIPLIVGFIARQESLAVRRAFWMASAFAFGILLSIVLIGVITAALGRLAGDLGAVGNYVVAVIFFLVGLYLLDVISFSVPGANPTRVAQRGVWAAFLLGAIFGIALGPCTFAYMAPVLALTFKVAAARPLFAVALLAAYGVGHCAVIVAAGTSAQAVQRYLNWSQSTQAAQILRKACGALVVCGGLYLLYTAR